MRESWIPDPRSPIPDPKSQSPEPKSSDKTCARTRPLLSREGRQETRDKRWKMKEKAWRLDCSNGQKVKCSNAQCHNAQMLSRKTQSLQSEKEKEKRKKKKRKRKGKRGKKKRQKRQDQKQGTQEAELIGARFANRVTLTHCCCRQDPHFLCWWCPPSRKKLGYHCSTIQQAYICIGPRAELKGQPASAQEKRVAEHEQATIETTAKTDTMVGNAERNQKVWPLAARRWGVFSRTVVSDLLQPPPPTACLILVRLVWEWRYRLSELVSPLDPPEKVFQLDDDQV